jgi:hypothetical protein
MRGTRPRPRSWTISGLADAWVSSPDRMRSGSTPHPPPDGGTFSLKGRRTRVRVSRGINGVPAVVVEGKWLISGGQPAGVFEEALRQMVGEL